MRPPTETVRVGLCLLSKDDALKGYLEEWLDYHKSIGVAGVVIMEDNSTQSALTVPGILRHVRSGFIIHYVFNAAQQWVRYPPPKDKLGPFPNNQIFAYNHCLRNYRNTFTHMGFIDGDEFIVIKNNMSISEALHPYKGFGGLTLNWMNMASNGHITRPSGGVLRNYNRCVRNCHVKSIVNTNAVVRTSNTPHHFLYKFGFYAVDTNFERVAGPTNPDNVNGSCFRSGLLLLPSESLYNVLYLNHYGIKSKQDWQEKMARGWAEGTKLNQDYFDYVDGLALDNCPFLQVKN